jgi:hypothetical protein
VSDAIFFAIDLVDLLAVARDRDARRRCACRGHRGDVGGHRDEEAGGRRAVARGPTNTATGVFAAMIALLMSRVESSSRPACAA